MADDIPLEDKLLQEERDARPPRYMLALVDFQTDTQRQIGAHKLDDFFTPLDKNQRKLLKSTDFWRFITFFKRLVKEASKNPWPVNEDGIVQPKEPLTSKDELILEGEPPELASEAGEFDDLTTEQRIIAAVAYAQEALGTDGADHKQYLLHKISRVLGAEYDDDEFDPGLAP